MSRREAFDVFLEPEGRYFFPLQLQKRPTVNDCELCTALAKTKSPYLRENARPSAMAFSYQEVGLDLGGLIPLAPDHPWRSKAA